MASSNFYVETPLAQSEVLSWFRGLEPTPEEFVRPDSSVFIFRHFGGLQYDELGKPNEAHSAIVLVYPPQIKRRSLWTVGEVVFLTVNSAPSGKAMAKVKRRFQYWLRAFQQIYGGSSSSYNEFDYYLEGNIQNVAREIFALPTGYVALRSGQYFIGRQANDCVLDQVCKTLRLRGVDCG
ncbi:MAG: hypothetical protein V4586_16105 [Pseudomonadota bacterium]